MLAVVLGVSSDAARASEAQKLLNWGFQAFDTVQLYQSGKQVTTLRVWKGAAPEVPAGFLADRYLTLPKGKADKLQVTMQAQVSVLDRGFIYGDGVYELVPVYAGEPFRLPHHLARLARSLDGIRLANPHTDAEWERIIRDLAARQPPVAAAYA